MATTSFTVTPGGNTSATSPYTLTSNPASWLSFVPDQPILFSDLTSLSLSYNVLLGGIGGGAPRIDIGFTDGTDLLVYLGPSPSFVDPTLGPASSGNLLVNDDGRFDNGGVGGSSTSNYAAALGLAGSKTINIFQIQVDSFNGADKTIVIGADGLTADVATPEPGSAALLGSGLAGLWFVARRRAQRYS